MRLVTHLDQPACGKPEHLPLVDAAFERPGGPAGDEMRAKLCTGCPAGHHCLALAMMNRQFGVWGGASPNTRTRHGGPPRQPRPKAS